MTEDEREKTFRWLWAASEELQDWFKAQGIGPQTAIAVMGTLITGIYIGANLKQRQSIEEVLRGFLAKLYEIPQGEPEADEKAEGA